MVAPEDIERELSDKAMDLASVFACYERVYCHLFTSYYDFKHFPAFFCDRFLGWEYSQRHKTDPEIRNEPFLPKNDGFQEFCDLYVRTTKQVPAEHILDEIYDAFKNRAKVSLPLSWPHADGTFYMTFILFEGLTEDDDLFYTKLSTSERVINRRMSVEEIQKIIRPDSNGYVPVEIVKPDVILEDVINELKNLSFTELVKTIFTKYYNLKIRNDKVYSSLSHGYLRLDREGYDKFISYLKKHQNQVLSGYPMPKTRQIKLTDHMVNKIKPLMNFIEYSLDQDNQIPFMAGQQKKELFRTCNEVKTLMSRVTEKANTLIKNQTDSNYDTYVRAIEGLRDNLAPLQRQGLQLVSTILKG